MSPAIELAILVISGLLTGLYASVAGGGSLVTTPLLLLLGLPIHNAIATSRLSGVFLQTASIARFQKEGKGNLKYGLIFGLIGTLGTFLGTRWVIEVDEATLNLVAGILLVLIFLILTFKQSLGEHVKASKKQKLLIIMPLMLLLGVYGGFFGVGVGTFTLFLLLFSGMDFINSAATGRIIGLFISGTAAIVFALNGFIAYPHGIALGVGLAIGGWIGAGVGVKKGNRYVRLLFLVILAIGITKLIADSLLFR